MPCIWGRHNAAQIFISVAILPVNSSLLIPGVRASPPVSALANALVDTGATTTCVSAAFAQRAGLRPIVKIALHGVGGPVYHNSYLFFMAFPLTTAPGVAPVGQSPSQFHVVDKPIHGAEFQAPRNFEVLLGMDILSMGSLVVQGGDGSFSFSF